MNMDDQIEPDNLLPRWVTIPLGIVLVPFTVFCVIGSSMMLIAPNVPVSALTILIGSVFLGGSIWVCALSFRLLLVNPNNKHGFMSPISLRLAGLIFAIIPLASLFTGTFWEKPILHSVMSIGYFGILVTFFKLAKARSKNA